MASRHANLFLDTSAIIHGVSIDQIDWRTLVAADAVLLLIPVNVIRELDRHKDGSDGRAARKRARAFFSKYVRFDAPPLPEGDVIRDGVRLRLLHSDARMSDRPELDPTVGDDRIVAEVLAFKAEGERRIVVSADNGLLVKARAAGLEPLLLSEELQRAPEPDETEKKLAETTRELAQLKHRLPDVQVSLYSPLHDDDDDDDDDVERPVSVALRIRKAASETEIERAYEVEASRAFARVPAGPFGPAITGISRQDVREHLVAYRKYLEELAIAECFRSRTFPLAVQISNEGTGPASDVYLRLVLPDGFEVFEEEDLPSLPERPRVRNVIDSITAADVALMGLRHRSEPIRDPDDPEAHGTHARYRVRNVLHHAPRPLGSFIVVVPEQWAGRGFEVEAMIQAAEHVQPKEQRLQVLTTVEHSELRLVELVQRISAAEDS